MSDWHLEVVDEFNNSTVWDDKFPWDAEALEEPRLTIRDTAGLQHDVLLSLAMNLIGGSGAGMCVIGA
jgi:hypothetical protein